MLRTLRRVNKQGTRSSQTQPPAARIPNSHCNFCGTSFTSLQWPRMQLAEFLLTHLGKCSCCNNLTFRNPIPVAVGVLKIKMPSSKTGLLLVKRKIPPFVGELAFPGGFVCDWTQQQPISDRLTGVKAGNKPLSENWKRRPISTQLPKNLHMWIQSRPQKGAEY